MKKLLIILTLISISFALMANDKNFRRKVLLENNLRNVPSGGALHPFETYLVISKIKGLNIGLYRYLPMEHKLLLVREDPKIIEKLDVKGIKRFIAFELPVEKVKAKYGNHFSVVMGDLYQTDDLRVLDYNGHNVFYNFSFSEMGDPIFHE